MTEPSLLRQWLKVLKPMFWWLLLVLVFYGIRTHQRLMGETRLSFNVTLAGQFIYAEPAATIDGKPASSGQLISLGHHQLTITHPKGETYATNLFIWYGAHDLGTINLKRATGTLTVTVTPPAARLSISGPEWSVVLTNSTGTNISVPTDRYVIETHYAHWEKADYVTVNDGTVTPWSISPDLGGVQLSCNQKDAYFTLFNADGVQIATGTFPALIKELPAGIYKLVSDHHQHRLDQVVTVTTGTTSQLSAEFLYGQVLVDSVPAGASIFDDNGGYRGVTPLSMSELPAGTSKFKLQLNGYEDAILLVPVKENQTVEIRTNLTSFSYLNGMDSARKYLTAADFQQAAATMKEVLAAKPDDVEALALQRQIIGLWNIQTAKGKGGQGDFIGGITFLQHALEKLPDNEEARQLLADYQQRAPAQLEQQRQDRLNRPAKVFDEVKRKFSCQEYFEDRHVTTRKSAQDAAAAISSALQQSPIVYSITENSSPEPGVYEVVVMQDVTSVAPKGLRRFIIVCGQTSDDETTIFYKVMEYKGEAAVKFSIGNLINHPVSENYIPLHAPFFPNLTDKDKAQVQEGVDGITAIVKAATQ